MRLSVYVNVSAIALMAILSATALPGSQTKNPAGIDLPITIPELRLPTLSVESPTLSLRLPERQLHPPRLPEHFMECGGVFEFVEEQPALGLVDFFGATDDLRTALAADSVQIIELTTKAERPRSIRVSDVDAARLRASLTSDFAYSWDKESSPLFLPFLRVIFWKGETSVTIDLDLSSRTARVPKTEHHVAPTSIEFGYSTLVAVVERNFPGVIDD